LTAGSAKSPCSNGQAEIDFNDDDDDDFADPDLAPSIDGDRPQVVAGIGLRC
jgi:hypothetical protein